MAHKVHVLHYLNQFFGGIGGEDKADIAAQIRSGPVGPGLALAKMLGDSGEIVATCVCGDNYFSANTGAVVDQITEACRADEVHVVVAGPAFNAGRYGFACGELCKSVAERLGIPAITGMFEENPGLETYRKQPGVWIFPTSSRASDMAAVLPKLAAFALKLGTGTTIGPAREEGYFPTGRRVVRQNPVRTVDRAFSMLMAKVAGSSFQTEIPIEKFDAVPPAAPVPDLKKARLAVITTSGLVPKGNPDHFRMFNATQWHKYRLPEDRVLRPDEWEIIHGGFNTSYAQANPYFVLPLDALVAIAGNAYGELADSYYSITGVGTSLKIAREAGQEIAASLREDHVDAALLVAT
jgi:glycine reductase